MYGGIYNQYLLLVYRPPVESRRGGRRVDGGDRQREEGTLGGENPWV